MSVDFYYVPGSPPCRAAMLTARAVGLELNLKLVNLMGGEQLKPDFLAMNPQHCVPTINDGGFNLWESRAVCQYFANQYGNKDSLYPKEPKKRAIVDSRLCFDQGTIYQRIMDYYYPVMFAGASYDEAKLKKLHEAFELLDNFLDGKDWVAGDNMTIADFSLVASISTAEVVGFEMSKYPHVSSWLQKCKTTIPGYDEINQKGLDAFKTMFDHLTKK